MAFADKGLEVTPTGASAGAGAENMLHTGRYVTTDAKATVLAANYFNSAYKRLPKGTILEIVSDLGGTPATVRGVITASSSSGVTFVLQATT
jgi:predicted transcriptional regulator